MLVGIISDILVLMLRLIPAVLFVSSYAHQNKPWHTTLICPHHEKFRALGQSVQEFICGIHYVLIIKQDKNNFSVHSSLKPSPSLPDKIICENEIKDSDSKQV